MRILLFISLMFSLQILEASEIKATRSGKWQDKSVWNCNCVPGNADHVTIPSGIKVTSSSSIILNLGPKIAIMIDGTLELINGSLLTDAEDIIAIGEGGMITSAKTTAVLYSGTVAYFVPIKSPVLGPASISAGTSMTGLLFFRAKRQNEEILIDWALSENKPQTVFTLQRSPDGIHYHDLTEINAGNEQPQRVECSWYDSRPLHGLAYYRLLLTDDSGSVSMTVIAFAGEGTKRRTF